MLSLALQLLISSQPCSLSIARSALGHKYNFCCFCWLFTCFSFTRAVPGIVIDISRFRYSHTLCICLCFSSIWLFTFRRVTFHTWACKCSIRQYHRQSDHCFTPTWECTVHIAQCTVHNPSYQLPMCNVQVIQVRSMFLSIKFPCTNTTVVLLQIQSPNNTLYKCSIVSRPHPFISPCTRPAQIQASTSNPPSPLICTMCSAQSQSHEINQVHKFYSVRVSLSLLDLNPIYISF